MLALMITIALMALVVGPATLTGHPLLILVGAVLGAAVMLVSRRGRQAGTARR